MMRGMVTGVLYETPSVKTSKTGNNFVTAKIKDDSAVSVAWYSVVAFGELAETLGTLAKGESVSVSGKMDLEIYTGRDSIPRIAINIVADQVLTLKRKKKLAVKTDRQTDSGDSRSSGHYEDSPEYDENAPF